MGRPVVHFELWSQDPKKVGAFYEKAFGWTIRAIPVQKRAARITATRKGSP